MQPQKSPLANTPMGNKANLKINKVTPSLEMFKTHLDVFSAAGSRWQCLSAGFGRDILEGPADLNHSVIASW